MSTKQQSQNKQWSGAFAAYKPSKEAVMTNISIILLIGLIAFASQIVISIFIKNEAIVQIASNIITYIVGPAYYIAILQGIAKNKVDLQPTLQKGLSYFVQYFILNVLTGIILAASFIAFIIPFFFVMPRVILAPYYLIDKNMDAIAALKASWDQTKGHSSKVWGIIGASLVMALPVLTIVGIPVAIYLLIMYSAATGLLYKYITSTKPAAQE
jgi:uncharacterized membrane protein